jgi:hypothetical protein
MRRAPQQKRRAGSARGHAAPPRSARITPPVGVLLMHVSAEVGNALNR